jgi:hypothetical protein
MALPLARADIRVSSRNQRNTNTATPSSAIFCCIATNSACHHRHHKPSLRKVTNGYAEGLIGVHTSVKQPAGGQKLDTDNRTYNALPRGLRALGERRFAILTGRWRTPHNITTSPCRIGDIVKAGLLFTHFEHGRPV